LPDHVISTRRVIHTLAVDLLNGLPVHEYDLAGAQGDGLQDFWFDERKLPEHVPDPRRIGGPIDRPTVSEVAHLYNLHGNQKHPFFHVTVRILYSLSKKYDFQDADQSSLDARFMPLVPEDDPQLRGLITGQGGSGETAIVDAVREFVRRWDLSTRNPDSVWLCQCSFELTTLFGINNNVQWSVDPRSCCGDCACDPYIVCAINAIVSPQ
jgi:hypothetical protein